MIGTLRAVDHSDADSRRRFLVFGASEYCSGRRRLMQHGTRPDFVQDVARVAINAERLQPGRTMNNATAYCVKTILDRSSGNLSTGGLSREVCRRPLLDLFRDV